MYAEDRDMLTNSQAELAALLDQDECEGHPAGPFDPMGATVFCPRDECAR